MDLGLGAATSVVVGVLSLLTEVLSLLTEGGDAGSEFMEEDRLRMEGHRPSTLRRRGATRLEEACTSREESRTGVEDLEEEGEDVVDVLDEDGDEGADLLGGAAAAGAIFADAGLLSTDWARFCCICPCRGPARPDTAGDGEGSRVAALVLREGTGAALVGLFAWDLYLDAISLG